MRILILALVAIVVLAGLFFYLGQPTGVPDPDDNLDQINGENEADSSWETYESRVNQDFSLSLRYPERATISKVGTTIYEIKYIGPLSEPNTEITDGYYASLTFHEEPDLEAYIEEQNPTGQIETTTFNDRDARTFETESEIGDQTTKHIAYRLFDESDWIVDITYNVYGEKENEYQGELFTILQSIIASELGASTGSDMTTLQIAMLDYDQLGEESTGATRGCDRLVFIEETVPATTTPLNASMRVLFDYNETEVEGWQNFIAETNDTLHFERATIENGVASVYLTGELSGLSGVCDNPRARIQIEETALQFSTIDNVVLYLNGEETELQPSGRGT